MRLTLGAAALLLLAFLEPFGGISATEVGSVAGGNGPREWKDDEYEDLEVGDVHDLQVQLRLELSLYGATILCKM